MENRKHLYCLDLLKFLLSVIILLHHFQLTTELDFGVFDFAEGTVNFAITVEFFFIISGFLSAERTNKTKEEAFGSFMLSKIRRLYPMVCLSVLMMAFVMYVNYLISGTFVDGLIPDVYKLLGSLLVCFSGGAVKAGRGINNPMWYVSVLMICYAVFYATVHLSKEKGFKELNLYIVVCFIGIGIHDYGIELPFLNESVSRGYAAFFFGAILYQIYQKCSERFLTFSSSIILAFCSILAILDYQSFYQYEWGALTFVVFPCILFVSLGLERFLKLDLLRKAGGISFEMYVWHSFFNLLIVIFSGALKPLYQRPAVFVLVYIIVVIVFSAVIYRFEKPLQRCLENVIIGSVLKKNNLRPSH